MKLTNEQILEAFNIPGLNIEASLEPRELALFCNGVRYVFAALTTVTAQAPLTDEQRGAISYALGYAPGKEGVNPAILEPLRTMLAAPVAPAAAAPSMAKDEDFVLVRRALLGAACYAINRKRDAPGILAKLREAAKSNTAPTPTVAADAAAPSDEREFHEAVVKLVNDMLDAWIAETPYRQVSSGLQARINALLTAPVHAAAETDEHVYALQLLVAAGHVTQAKVDEALEIARKTPGVAQPDERAAIHLDDATLDRLWAQYKRGKRTAGGDHKALFGRVLEEFALGMATTECMSGTAPVFEGKSVALKQHGAKLVLTLELDAIEGAPRYAVTPINPAIVRAGGSDAR